MRKFKKNGRQRHKGRASEQLGKGRRGVLREREPQGYNTSWWPEWKDGRRRLLHLTRHCKRPWIIQNPRTDGSPRSPRGTNGRQWVVFPACARACVFMASLCTYTRLLRGGSVIKDNWWWMYVDAYGLRLFFSFLYSGYKSILHIQTRNTHGGTYSNKNTLMHKYT